MKLRYVMLTLLMATTAVTSCGGLNKSELNQAPATGMPPWFLAMQSGDYQFIQYDRAKLESEFLQEIFKGRKEDYEYYKKSVDAIETEFKGFIRETIYKEGTGLKILSDKTTYEENFIPASELVAAINKYAERKLALDVTITTLSSVADSALPSYKLAEGKNKEGADLPTLPPLANQNFGKIKDFYAEKLKMVDVLVSNFGHKVELLGTKKIIPAGKGQGLTVPLPKYQLTGKQIAELETQIRTKRSWSISQRKALEEYGVYTRQLIGTFMDNYGWSEKWRFQREDRAASMKKDLEDIERVFFARTFFRYFYNMPLGTYKLRYTKKIVNLDIFLNKTSEFLQFDQQMAFAANDLQTAEQNIKLIFDRVSARSQKILDGNLGVVNTIENAMTWVGGERPAAGAMLFIVELLAKDIVEERMISRPDGLPLLSAHFRSLYRSEDNRTKFLRIQATLDQNSISDAQKEELEKDKNFVFGAGYGPGSVGEVYAKIQSVGIEKTQDLEEALDLEATKRAAMANSTFLERARSRVAE